MLIPEAAQLVVQAGAMARGGDLFVLDMGEPVRIADLARTMLHLSGLTERTAANPDGDIDIEYVGLRPGEKLYEELLIGESIVPSGHPRIMCARERHIEPALLDKMIESLRLACEGNDAAAMLRQLRNVVPEYRSADEVNAEASALTSSAERYSGTTLRNWRSMAAASLPSQARRSDSIILSRRAGSMCRSRAHMMRGCPLGTMLSPMSSSS